jgi:predicted HNH restriction endonuclease
MICKKCGAIFPISIVVDGKRRNLKNRKFCIGCSPFKLHNTKNLALSSETKTCKKCGEQKDISDFYGKRAYCKTCYNDYSKNKYVEYKRKVVIMMGGKCQVCGYDKYAGSLELHHIDPATKDPNFDMFHNRVPETFIDEMKKCVLVCANCHREIHAGVTNVPITQ